MKNLNLSTIIAMNEIAGNQILIELLIPYKKSLYTYYKSLFCDEPILMVTSVMNAVQYGKIVSANNFSEEIVNFIGNPDCINDDNDNYCEYETICFNSIPLSKL